MWSLRKCMAAVTVSLATGGALAQAVDFDQVINVDVGPTEAAYAGQGALADVGNDFWNRITNTGIDLVASDGVTTTSVAVNLSSLGGFAYPWANANELVNDYLYVNTFNIDSYIGSLEISGLTAGVRYLVYVYSAGDQENQGALIELNDQRAATSGVPLEQFTEGKNYVIMEVVADANGRIAGTYRPFASASSAAINGLQIKALAPGERPAHARKVAGAESPQVHSPGDRIELAIDFSREVTLSQAGGLTVQLDFNGTQVTATHFGATSGTQLTFEATAPAVTAAGGSIVPDSFALVGGASLQDDDGVAASLEIDALTLAHDGVSVAGLSVYPPVASLESQASPHYAFRVRQLNGANTQWQSSFAWLTKSTDFNPDLPTNGYYNNHIGGWSHTFTNFEMANNVPVEVEITRLDPDTGEQVDIEKAAPHPRRRVSEWRVENGRAYVTIDRPTLFAVDIDGALDDALPTSDQVNENAIHTVSVFANPFILDKPDPQDPDVFVVQPGDPVPNDGPWSTLYFAPGEHQIFTGDWVPGDALQLRSNRSYYIPGNAIVHGNMNNRENDDDSRNIRIFGHGVLSGERIPHNDVQGIDADNDPDSAKNRAIRIASKARGSSVEGITLVDPANHALAIDGDLNADPANTNPVRWAKVFTWRANGDGISANGSGVLEDSFLRTQDDGTYVKGLAVRRVVYWSDVNGMPLRLSNMLNDNVAAYRLYGPLEVEDIDIIYSRTRFGSGPERSMIGFNSPAPGAFPLNDGSHIVFRNIRVEDRFPTRMLFGWDMNTGDGGIQPVQGVRFENVRAPARNVDGETSTFLGNAAAPISGLIFDNVLLDGEHYGSMDDFVTNGFTSGFVFENTAPQTMTYLGGSTVQKWQVDGDWDSGVEPAANDVVQHTAVGADVMVDATVYAGTLNVGHSDLARVMVNTGGELRVSDTLSVGATGTGEVLLADGTLRVANPLASALQLGDSALRIEGGTLAWNGDHIADLQSLFDGGALVPNGGRAAAPVGQLIGANGGSALYARFDAAAGVTLAQTFALVDTDGDGIADTLDNCSAVANADQRDTDGDGYGNACDADLNNDCIVNVVDLGLLRAVFFTSDANADLNGDGVVNVVDLGLMRAAFFAPPGPGTGSCNGVAVLNIPGPRSVSFAL